MYNKGLAKTVKELRKKKALSQEELAKRAGVSLRTIQRVENEETVPMGDTLLWISNVFGLLPEELGGATKNKSQLKETVAVKNGYLHVFADKLIISKTTRIDNLTFDYKKSVNDIFKSLILFLISISVFSVLAVVFYKMRPDISFYAIGYAVFCLLISIYIMLFTSGIPAIISKDSINKIRFQSTIFGSKVMVIYYVDIGKLKQVSVHVTKEQIATIENLLETKFLGELDVENKSNYIRIHEIIVIVMICFPFFIHLNGMWIHVVVFTVLNLFILFLIVSGLMNSYLIGKKKTT